MNSFANADLKPVLIEDFEISIHYVQCASSSLICACENVEKVLSGPRFYLPLHFFVNSQCLGLSVTSCFCR